MLENKLLQQANLEPKETVKQLLLVVFLFLIGLGVGDMVGEGIARRLGIGSIADYVTILCAYIGAASSVLIYICGIKKASINRLGFYKTRYIGQYIRGILLGTLGISSIVFFLSLTNQAHVVRNVTPVEINIVSLTIIILITWIIQGAAEELLFRGYLLPSIASMSNLYKGIIVSSILFAVMHLSNEGINMISLLNLLLCGVLLALLAIKQQSIWGVCGFHTAWNLVQGNIFGVAVSGRALPETIWVTNMTGSQLMTGGVFGIEGSILTTFFMTAVIVVLVIMLRREWLLTGQLEVD